jgi:hypothetical protein
MNRKILALAGGALLLAASSGASWAADISAPPDWGCTCLTQGGSADGCTATASITGSVLTLAVGESWGEGTYVARHLPHRTIVNGVVTTATGTEMTVTIVDWAGDHVDRGWLSAARVGVPDFTAECTGTVP